MNLPLRKIAFGISTILMFLRISMLGQIQGYLMHGVNLRLLYVFGVPAILGIVLAGGIGRTLRNKTSYWYIALLLWIAIACPFSSWRGGSFGVLTTYFRTDFIMLPIAAGLAITWKECRLLLGALGAAAFVNLLSSRMFSTDKFGYREGLQFGDIGNPNDYAGHLLFVLPFLLLIVLTGKKFPIRVLALAGLGWGMKLILGTASRGALIGVVLASFIFLLRGTARQRTAFLLLAPLIAGIGILTVSHEALTRIISLSSDDATSKIDLEAAESKEAREYVLKKSIEYMVTYPIFGVGPGQFASFEGKNNKVLGNHGYWHETHNSFTQVASECGVPAGIFLLGGVISTFLLLNRALRMVKPYPQLRDLRDAVVCSLVCLVGFTTAATFLNFGYHCYFPLIAGIAIILSKVAAQEIKRINATA